jgi:hypothetical protein
MLAPCDGTVAMRQSQNLSIDRAGDPGALQFRHGNQCFGALLCGANQQRLRIRSSSKLPHYPRTSKDKSVIFKKKRRQKLTSWKPKRSLDSYFGQSLESMFPLPVTID